MWKSLESLSSTGLTLSGGEEESPGAATPEPATPAAKPRRSRRAFSTRMLAMFALVAVVMIGIGVLGDRAMKSFQRYSSDSTTAITIEAQLDRMLASLKDAESDLRGYILTNRRDQLLDFLAAE